MNGKYKKSVNFDPSWVKLRQSTEFVRISTLPTTHLCCTNKTTTSVIVSWR